MKQEEHGISHFYNNAQAISIHPKPLRSDGASLYHLSHEKTCRKACQLEMLLLPS